MTVKELSQLYYLNREIEMDKERLEELRAKAEGPASVVLTGMPPSRDNESRVERYAVMMADLEAAIKAKQEQCIHECERLEKYIAGIADSVTRMIFTLRFVKGLSWRRVVERLGGGNTEWGIKRRVYRYLEKN